MKYGELCGIVSEKCQAKIVALFTIFAAFFAFTNFLPPIYAIFDSKKALNISAQSSQLKLRCIVH